MLSNALVRHPTHPPCICVHVHVYCVCACTRASPVTCPGLMTPIDYVRATSTAAAQAFNIYPQKVRHTPVLLSVRESWGKGGGAAGRFNYLMMHLQLRRVHMGRGDG